MSQSPVEQIKEKLSIVDVVSTYVKLEKAGLYMRARCPFHNEKTPSFVVSPNRNTYHCFGCNRGGDIFSFVQEIEGEDFRTVLGKLALRAGVVLTNDFVKEDAPKKRLYALMEEAKKFFEVQLYQDTAVKEYLVGRGLVEGTIRNFHLGYIQNNKDVLFEYLKRKGYTKDEMEKVGLLGVNERGTYDRFRGRIMFPLSDTEGKIVGFTGRIFKDTGDIAKYLNSPETVLYSKSKVLYGYDKAKRSMMQENVCVAVEGQLDLLLSHQVGVVNTVAVSGTALTNDHLLLIKRFAETIVFAFDGDSAGFKAGHRATELALALGFDVKLCLLPEGIDPADYIVKYGGDAWKEQIKNAPHLIDFYLTTLQAGGKDIREFRKEVSKVIIPLLAKIPNLIEQSHFLSRIAYETQLPETVLHQELAKVALVAKIDTQNKEERISQTKEDHIIRKLMGIFMWMKDDVTLLPYKEQFETYTKVGYTLYEETYGDALKEQMIFEAESTYSGADIHTIIQELLLLFIEEQKIKDLEQIKVALHHAELSQDEIQIKEALEKYQKTKEEVEQLKTQYK